MRSATTYSPNAGLGVSTISPDRLNCRVRNGNGCVPVGNVTGLIRLSSKIKVGVRSCSRQFGSGLRSWRTNATNSVYNYTIDQ